MSRGVLVAVDGPKGGGKTTILAMVKGLLTTGGLNVLLTKEPTERFRLSNEQEYTGLELAELLVADRAVHVREDVLPALETCDVVIIDRYIASSVVFRLLDGVPSETIWEMNRDFPLPHLNLFLLADEPSLRRRRQARAHKTRLEGSDVAAELRHYAHVKSRLEAQGVATATVDNSDGAEVAMGAAAIATAILSVIKAPRV